MIKINFKLQQLLATRYEKFKATIKNVSYDGNGTPNIQKIKDELRANQLKEISADLTKASDPQVLTLQDRVLVIYTFPLIDPSDLVNHEPSGQKSWHFEPHTFDKFNGYLRMVIQAGATQEQVKIDEVKAIFEGLKEMVQRRIAAANGDIKKYNTEIESEAQTVIMQIQAQYDKKIALQNALKF